MTQISQFVSEMYNNITVLSTDKHKVCWSMNPGGGQGCEMQSYQWF